MNAPSLGLFRLNDRSEQPRDARGRYAHVTYTPERLAVLKRAVELRAALGLPADPRLIPFTLKDAEMIR
jgi:hypothetical protein